MIRMRATLVVASLSALLLVLFGGGCGRSDLIDSAFVTDDGGADVGSDGTLADVGSDAFLDGPVPDAGTCTNGTRCAGKCVDVESDPANCGRCGNACQANQVCSNGACARTCAPPKVNCNRACVDPNND